MQLGVFAKTFARPTVEEVFQAVVAHGLSCVQFNMSCAGLATMPDQIHSDVCARIRKAAHETSTTIAAMSGTFNIIHPDPAQRRDGLQRLEVLAAACKQIGVPIITLCTGSRDPHDMWRRHPANDTPEAWSDLVTALREALRMVDDPQITLAFEPETANVIDSALKAHRLLDEIASPRLRVVLDAANLLRSTNLDQMSSILQEAFDLLGPDIVMAHAKDVRVNGELRHVPAGSGVLDYDKYIGLLRSMDFEGPLILHGLPESDVRGCVAFLQGKLAANARATGRGMQ